MLDRLTRRWLGAALVLAAAWVAVAWEETERHRRDRSDQAVAEEIAEAERMADGIAQGIERVLTLRKGVAATLAQDDAVRRFVASRHGANPLPGTPTLAEMNRFLAAAAGNLGLSALWIGDAHGKGIASGMGGEADNAIGRDFSDRPYFHEVSRGRLSTMFALGRVTHLPGFFYAAPILDEDHHFIGFVVAKVEMGNLDAWIGQADCLLTDDNGVAIAARNHDFEMHAVAGAPVNVLTPEAVRRQYGMAPIPPLRFVPYPDPRYPRLVRLGDADLPNAIHSEPLAAFGLTVTAMSPVPRLLEIEREHLFVFAVTAAAGVLLIGVVAALLNHLHYIYVSRYRLHRQKLLLAQAEGLAHLGSWELDHRSRAWSCSDECRRIVSDDEDDVVASLDDLAAKVHPGDREAVKRALRETLTSRDGGDIVFRLPGKAGPRFVQQRWQSEYDEHGTPTRTFGSIQDITGRKLLEEELMRSNTELERFAYVVSHDLRQPLRMVSSYLALITRRLGGRLEGEEREFLDFAVGGAKRMDELIVALLEYSRVGRTGSPELVRLDHAIGEALEHLSVAIAEVGAVVTVAPRFPRVRAHPLEMMRLFQNLVDNAVKYRAAGRVPRISLGWRDEGGDWLLWVRDNGIGIAAADHDRAFMVFQRLVRAETCEGTGIGLAICRKIVETAGGRIWVESEPGVGSTFFFTLPKAG